MLTKEEVLKEIRRYAKKNDGKTPSEKVFYEYGEIGVHEPREHWANYFELLLF